MRRSIRTCASAANSTIATTPSGLRLTARQADRLQNRKRTYKLTFVPTSLMCCSLRVVSIPLNSPCSLAHKSVITAHCQRETLSPFTHSSSKNEKSVSADVRNSRKRKFLRTRQDFTAHSWGRSAYSANVDTEARETQISVVGDSASPYGGKPP